MALDGLSFLKIEKEEKEIKNDFSVEYFGLQKSESTKALETAQINPLGSQFEKKERLSDDEYNPVDSRFAFMGSCFAK